MTDNPLLIRMAALVVGSLLGAAGLCYACARLTSSSGPLSHRTGDEESGGSSAERRHLLKPISRKDLELRQYRKDSDVLSTIVEGSEEGRQSSQPPSDLDDRRSAELWRPDKLRTQNSSRSTGDGHQEEKEEVPSPQFYKKLSSSSSLAAQTPTDENNSVRKPLETDPGQSPLSRYATPSEALAPSFSITTLPPKPAEEENPSEAPGQETTQSTPSDYATPSALVVAEPSKDSSSSTPFSSPLPLAQEDVPENEQNEAANAAKAKQISLYESIEPNTTRREVHESLKYAFVVDGVLTPAECDEYVRTTETVGYTKWTEDEARLAFRDCDTIEVSHPDIANLLWKRIAPLMHEWEKDCKIDTDDRERWQRDLEGQWIAYGTVNNILFSRYLEGGHFAIHTDGFNVESFDRRSLYSIVVYLNDVPEGDGGETIFFANDAKDKLAKDELGRYIGDPKYILARIPPKAGRATVFFHNILHQSEPIRLQSGSRKYIIRSDVMYERTPNLATDPKDNEAFSMIQKAELLSDSDPEESARLFRVAFKRSPLLCRVYGM